MSGGGTRHCGSCGEAAETIDLFCGHCGDRLSPESGPADGERTRTTLSAAEVNRRLGRVYLERGKPEDALRAWRKALSLEPGDKVLAYELAELERDLVDRVSP